MTAVFNKIEKFKLIGLCIKAITGVVGGSLVLEQNHPYITLGVLAAGAIADQFVTTLKEKEGKNKSVLADGDQQRG